MPWPGPYGVCYCPMNILGFLLTWGYLPHLMWPSWLQTELVHDEVPWTPHDGICRFYTPPCCSHPIASIGIVVADHEQGLPTEGTEKPTHSEHRCLPDLRPLQAFHGKRPTRPCCQTGSPRLSRSAPTGGAPRSRHPRTLLQRLKHRVRIPL